MLKRDYSTCPFCDEKAITYRGIELDEDNYGREIMIDLFECENCNRTFEENQLDWFDDWSEYLAPNESVMSWPDKPELERGDDRDLIEVDDNLQDNKETGLSDL